MSELDSVQISTEGSLPNHSKLANQPLVSFVVPCYNSAEFMRTCLDTLMAETRACEVIIVNDGSQDNTLEIAREYEHTFPHVTVIDQPNMNWGGAVNTGLAAAHGLFFKVVDSDDHLNTNALNQVLDAIHVCRENGELPDLLITNYVYDHHVRHATRTMSYSSQMPANRIFTWDEVGRASLGQYLMIHASWYRTEILRESGLKLPTGVSYMDSMFILHPLPYVKKLYYVNCDAYYYTIGREGQSVEVEVVKKHIDEQLLATKLAVDDYDLGEMKKIHPKMARTMMRYISCMLSVSTIYLFLIDTPESIEKNTRMWDYIAEHNPVLRHDVRHTLAGMANRKGEFGRYWTREAYTFSKFLYKFA